jgi:hypothetical protein
LKPPICGHVERLDAAADACQSKQEFFGFAPEATREVEEKSTRMALAGFIVLVHVDFEVRLARELALRLCAEL